MSTAYFEQPTGTEKPTLISMQSTDELLCRPARPPDHEAENRAQRFLAEIASFLALWPNLITVNCATGTEC